MAGYDSIPERTEQLLIEILFQLLNTENSSHGYVKERLQRAGVTPKEIEKLME
jgi:hypothetical protein